MKANISMVRTNPTIFFSLFVLAGSCIMFPGCATLKPVTPAGIRTDMEALCREITVNRSVINTLRDKRVGKTGFYYVLDSEGRVVFHPRPALIGTSFSKVWFINQLLTEKSGCLTYTLGNRTHYLFFQPLDESEILCLSIVSDDLSRPVECKAAQVKPDE